MKETENKARMLNFEKSISSQKNIFTSLRWYKNEFLWYIWSKKNRYESEKPTIASTTSELSDGLRKNNSFMSIYIENVPKLCVWLQLFWVVMQHLSFSQSKLSKRFQLQTNEISNFIVASLDIRFSFSTSQNRKKWPKMIIFST